MANFEYRRFPVNKITKGDLKFGMTYKIGNKYTPDQFELVDILYDDHFFHKTGSERYHLFLDDGSPELMLWKSITGTDITPEYDIYKQRID